MNRFTVGWMCALTLVAVCGCKTSPRGGGPRADEGFSVVVKPNATVKQGQMEPFAVSVHRGDSFKRDVTLEFQCSSRAVHIEPARTVIRASDRGDTQVHIMADKEAALGDYSVRVKASPQSGEPTSTEFTVKVAAP